MSMEYRLNKARRAVALALHEKGQRLAAEIQEVNAGIDDLVKVWSAEHGVDTEKLDCSIQGKGDGELYLICQPKPEPVLAD